MSDRAFVDTNVLVYAHDLDAGERHAVAARLVAELWETRRAVISTQVLQEFYLNATRKIASPLPRATARQIARAYAAWQTELVGPPEILLASELEEQHQLSFWDALIVAAALKGGASTILTEDMSAGRSISGVRIENPFATGQARPAGSAPGRPSRSGIDARSPRWRRGRDPAVEGCVEEGA